MKSTKEIYFIIFNKFITGDRLVSDSYTLGVLSFFGVPESIVLKGDRVIISFDNKREHIITYDKNVELVYRKIENKENGTVIDNQLIKRRGRPRKNK